MNTASYIIAIINFEERASHQYGIQTIFFYLATSDHGSTDFNVRKYLDLINETVCVVFYWLFGGFFLFNLLNKQNKCYIKKYIYFVMWLYAIQIKDENIF